MHKAEVVRLNEELTIMKNNKVQCSKHGICPVTTFSIEDSEAQPFKAKVCTRCWFEKVLDGLERF